LAALIQGRFFIVESGEKTSNAIRRQAVSGIRQSIKICLCSFKRIPIKNQFYVAIQQHVDTNQKYSLGTIPD